MNIKPAPILFLDSGIGGLSVMQAAAKIMPHQNFLYCADYAGAPYGPKSEAEIASRIPALLGRLAERYKPSLITIACNTACTIALSHVRAALNLPIVGTVPAIKPAAIISKTKVFGLLGTDATIRQPYIDRMENNYAKGCKMIRFAAPQLVSAAEAKMCGETVNPSLYKQAIAGLTHQIDGDKIDHIILGCTHFPLLIDELSAYVIDNIKFLDGGEGIANQILRLMLEHNTPPSENGTPEHHFITSGNLDDIESYKPALKAYNFTEFSKI